MTYPRSQLVSRFAPFDGCPGLRQLGPGALGVQEFPGIPSGKELVSFGDLERGSAPALVSRFAKRFDGCPGFCESSSSTWRRAIPLSSSLTTFRRSAVLPQSKSSKTPRRRSLKMRVLLDESVPEKLGKLLGGHACSTVQRQGWASVKNGKLLALAKDQFDLLLTADQGMEYQQNQARFPIAILVVRAKSNRLEDLGSRSAGNLGRP